MTNHISKKKVQLQHSTFCQFLNIMKGFLNKRRCGLLFSNFSFSLISAIFCQKVEQHKMIFLYHWSSLLVLMYLLLVSLFSQVYGHGYEIFTVASNHSGTLLASSCKAAQAEHANILLTETETWTKVASLQNGHALTIVQMAFRFGFCENEILSMLSDFLL